MLVRLLETRVVPVGLGIVRPLAVRELADMRSSALLGLRFVARRLHEGAELADRHLMHAHVKRPRQRHLVLRPFAPIRVSARLLIRRAHPELARRNRPSFMPIEFTSRGSFGNSAPA